MIKIENLYKNYGSIQAVQDMSLFVPKGQILGMLGPNGAGKSTTLRILTGFLEPTAGRVTLGGHVVHDEPLKTRKLIGYLPESTPLYKQMLVFDYLQFIARSRNIPKNECEEKIRRTALRCDIVEFIHRPIGELSKGQRQRVGLAMAILDDPEVLILDEPTSGLDPNQVMGIRKIIKEIGKEKTIIFSTHILSEAEATCDRIVIVNNGKIAADGTVSELKNQMSHSADITIRLDTKDSKTVEDTFSSRLGDNVHISSCRQEGDETLLVLQGSDMDSDTLKAEVKGIIKQSDWFMLGMESKNHSLEEIFHELTLDT